jgi:hypothetical protein
MFAALYAEECSVFFNVTLHTKKLELAKYKSHKKLKYVRWMSVFSFRVVKNINDMEKKVCI